MEDEKVKLYIPLGITTRIDYMQGFGKKELMQSLIGILFGAGIATIGYILTEQGLTVVIIMIFAIGGSILATTKSMNNQSVVDIISDSIKFNNERKSYPYRQVKEWE